MKLKEIYNQIIKEAGDPQMLKMANVDNLSTPENNPEADSDAQVLLLMNQLGQVPGFIQALRQLQNPQAKYKAILNFADLLGIPENDFHAEMDQFRITSQQNNANSEEEF